MHIELFKIASAELGTKEIAGPEDQARILEYFKATGHKPTHDEVPWCSAFACWVVQKAGYPTPHSAWARNWLMWGKQLAKPEVGCICVFTRGVASGHVGFYSHEDDLNIFVLGGNQDNQVKVKPYKKSDLLAYRGLP